MRLYEGGGVVPFKNNVSEFMTHRRVIVKTYVIWEQCTKTTRYTVTAESEQDARELIIEGQGYPQETDFSDYEITEVLEQD